MKTWGAYHLHGRTAFENSVVSYENAAVNVTILSSILNSIFMLKFACTKTFFTFISEITDYNFCMQNN